MTAALRLRLYPVRSSDVRVEHREYLHQSYYISRILRAPLLQRGVLTDDAPAMVRRQAIHEFWGNHGRL